jgi:hypothetical protein
MFPKDGSVMRLSVGVCIVAAERRVSKDSVENVAVARGIGPSLGRAPALKANRLE